MVAHYCINCPRCKRGCSICRRCACTPAELDAWMNQLFQPVAPLLASPLMALPHEYLQVAPQEPTENVVLEDDGEQRPETD